MSDLQELWNDIPESPLSEQEVADTINRKSVSEIERFKKVLKWEVYISNVVLIPLLISGLFDTEIMMLFGFIMVVGWALNVFTLWKLKQIEPYQDVRHFLVRCIRALSYFVGAYLITAQLAGLVATILMKSWKAPGLAWMEWLSSSDGLLLILLLAMINVMLISYAWVFYIQRIRALNRLLHEMDHDE